MKKVLRTLLLGFALTCGCFMAPQNVQASQIESIGGPGGYFNSISHMAVQDVLIKCQAQYWTSVSVAKLYNEFKKGDLKISYIHNNLYAVSRKGNPLLAIIYSDF